ncbi:MAG: hypothetical protein ACJAZ2_002335 [Glaciecola sp.]|jgi:hypothetical protein
MDNWHNRGETTNKGAPLKQLQGEQTILASLDIISVFYCRIQI